MIRRVPDRVTNQGLVRGFTLVEMMASLVILGMVLVVVAQLGTWSLRERRQAAARQAALELAANVLEEARAQPWNALTAKWARDQRLPSELKSLLPDGRLTITVKADKDAPLTKRLTAEVRWSTGDGLPDQVVELVSLVSERSRTSTGEKK